MGIQAGGEVVVAAPRAVAFAVVSDAQQLGRCIPGCRDIRELAPNRYQATLSSRVAFATVTFTVQIEVTRSEPPAAIDARVEGDAVGLSGHVSAAATLALDDLEPGRTRIRYTADASLTGKLGGLGQPVFRATSAILAREFAANLKQAIERP